MLQIHFEELELCRCVLARLLHLSRPLPSGPRVPLQRLPLTSPLAARSETPDLTHIARAWSRSSSTTTSLASSCARIGGLLGKTVTIFRKPGSGQRSAASSAGPYARVPRRRTSIAPGRFLRYSHRGFRRLWNATRRTAKLTGSLTRSLTATKQCPRSRHRSSDLSYYLSRALQLAACDVKRERCGIGHVETLDLAGNVNAGHAVAGLLGQLTQALAFGTEHECERRTQSVGPQVGIARAVEADQQESPCAKFLKPAREVLHH